MKTQTPRFTSQFLRRHRSLRRRIPAGRQRRARFFADDANGKTRSLSEYKGKYVVLEWFNPGMPVREEALRQRQHAEAPGRIYRQRRRLVERSIHPLPGTKEI